MPRIKLALGTDRVQQDSFQLVEGSFVWPSESTWESFCTRHADIIPKDRIVMAKRRQYAKELKTSVVLQPSSLFSHIFPRDSYSEQLVIDIVLRNDDRVESMFRRLDKCQERIDCLRKRIDRIEAMTWAKEEACMRSIEKKRDKHR